MSNWFLILFETCVKYTFFSDNLLSIKAVDLAFENEFAIVFDFSTACGSDPP